MLKIAAVLVLLSGPLLHGLQAQSVLRVSEAPAVKIGMIEGPPEYLFGFITDALVLPGGGFLVVDRTASELRMFASDGRFVRTIARAGSGPGEFRHVQRPFLVDDTVIAADPLLSKIAYFTAAGEFIGTRAIPKPGASLIGVGTSGTYWWSWMVGVVPGPVHDMSADTLAIGVSRAEGSQVNTIAGWHAAWRFRRIPHPFAPVTRPLLFRDSLLLPDAITGTLSLLGSDGRTARRIRLPVTEVDATAAWNTLRREMDVREDLRDKRDWDIPQLPELPRIGAILSDDRGLLWVKLYDPAEDAHWLGGWAGGEGGTWNVFDENGRSRGAVTLPPRFTPLHIADGLLAGRYRDEWDVQYLVAFRVTYSDSR